MLDKVGRPCTGYNKQFQADIVRCTGSPIWRRYSIVVSSYGTHASWQARTEWEDGSQQEGWSKTDALCLVRFCRKATRRSILPLWRWSHGSASGEKVPQNPRFANHDENSDRHSPWIQRAGENTDGTVQPPLRETLTVLGPGYSHPDSGYCHNIAFLPLLRPTRVIHLPDSLNQVLQRRPA